MSWRDYTTRISLINFPHVDASFSYMQSSRNVNARKHRCPYNGLRCEMPRKRVDLFLARGPKICWTKVAMIKYWRNRKLSTNWRRIVLYTCKHLWKYNVVPYDAHRACCTSPTPISFSPRIHPPGTSIQNAPNPSHVHHTIFLYPFWCLKISLPHEISSQTPGAKTI